jgi:hypothetical protein
MYLDASAMGHATLYVSAGRRGLQVEIVPGDLIAVTGATIAHIVSGFPAFSPVPQRFLPRIVSRLFTLFRVVSRTRGGPVGERCNRLDVETLTVGATEAVQGPSGCLLWKCQQCVRSCGCCIHDGWVACWTAGTGHRVPRVSHGRSEHLRRFPAEALRRDSTE